MTIAILSDGLSKKINMSTYIDKTIKLRSFTGYARWMRDEYVMWNNTNVYYSVGFNSATITTNRYVWASLQFFDPYGYHDFIVLKKCQIEFILIGGGGNGGYSNGSGGGGGGSGGGIAQGLITANPGDAFCMILGLSGSSTVLQQVVSVNQGTYRAYNVAQAEGGANGGDTNKTEGRSGANGSGGRGESTVANGGSPGGSYGSRHPRPGLVSGSRTGYRGGVGANATPFTGGGGGGLGGVGGMVLATVLEGVELASHLHPKQELPVERSLAEEVEGQPDSTVQPDGLQSAEEEEEVLLHRSMVVLLMPIQEADRGNNRFWKLSIRRNRICVC